MQPLDILLWFLCFIAFVYIQAMICNGIHTSMVGSTEILPNGKHKDSEMIFYPFYKWLTRKSEKKTVIFYEGIYFKELVEKIYGVYGNIMPGVYDELRSNSYLMFMKDEDIEQMKGVALIIAKELQVATQFEGRHVRFFKEYENYALGKWIRKPFGQCIKCMASIYTVIPFWSVSLLLLGFHWFLVPVYIANVFCVTYVNYLIFKS